jgi:hypothetical protein
MAVTSTRASLVRLVSCGVQQSELVEPAERLLDSLARGLAVDVEGFGEFLHDLADRAVTIASVPDETRRRVELMDLCRAEIEHNRFVHDDPGTDIRAPLGMIV